MSPGHPPPGHPQRTGYQMTIDFEAKGRRSRENTFPAPGGHGTSVPSSDASSAIPLGLSSRLDHSIQTERGSLVFSYKVMTCCLSSDRKGWVA
jgi:hypothetical protein